MRQINIQVPRLHPIRNQKFSLNNIYPKIPQACYRSLSIKKKEIKVRSLSMNDFIKDISIESHSQSNPIWKLLLSGKSVERKHMNKTVGNESENKINISLDLKEMIRLKSRSSGKYKQSKSIQYDKKVKNKKLSLFSVVKSQQPKIKVKLKQYEPQTHSLRRSGCSLCQQILSPPTKHHIKLPNTSKNNQNGHIQSRSLMQ